MVATSAILLTALVINVVSRASRPDYPPVDRAGAEALLDDTARLARDGDYERLCQTVAASAGICRGLLQTAGLPGPDTPDIVAVSRLGESLVLHLRGQRADGTAFTSDFQVSWTDTADGPDLRSRTPIYWSGVQLVHADCHATDGASACTGVATAPSR
ncbi:hypothetical protein [Actinophytocola gossypii]|uniref:Uncharacterized protein n=1 Tax=Actinophytocola gossypii TaxID=2812003 RepID=A0ABT2JCF6_9PSEU|nr:hypothetical protein [Actinophytocola gossypii]MCT2584994.1 hypothetical protein [Actinophytocola gossypii]